MPGQEEVTYFLFMMVIPVKTGRLTKLEILAEDLIMILPAIATLQMLSNLLQMISITENKKERI